MSISLLDRGRLRLLSKRCERLELEISTLYHEAVKVQMPLETLGAIAQLARDIFGIRNRVFALQDPTETNHDH